MPQKTALYEYHKELKARLVDFAGWDMPIQYNSILKEHESVRENCGLFDCSHMGQFFVSGADAQTFIGQLITNSLDRIKVGKAIYSPMLYDNGTFVDDLIVYWLADQSFMLVVNASNIDKDFAWMQGVIDKFKFEVELKDRSSELSLLAIQGPTSPDLINAHLNGVFDELGSFEFKEIDFDGVDAWCCRTGYTGEKGVEVILPNEKAIALMKTFVDAGAAPCGLGARDTLRLEKGYSLYGNEIDDAHDPFTAGLKWTVDMSKSDFVGKGPLEAILKDGGPQKLVGYKVDGRALARHGAKVLNSEDQEIGVVTSGAFSPTLKQGIGLAYIHSDHQEDYIFLEVRNKKIEAKIHSRSFV
jgi:aminomethyltransferase